MKKFISLFLALSLGIYTYSQGQNWKITGNSISPGDFLGTNNNEPLIFKANGNEGLRIKPNGDLRIKNFDDNTYTGLIFINANGVLSKLNFTGNSSDVLLGNGSFGSFSSLSGWTLGGNNIYTTYNVGIGTNVTPEKLTVNGNILANGSISGTSLNVVDIVGAGKEFKISTSLCMKGIDVNTPGSRNELCGMNGDLFIQSEHNNNYNTVFGLGNGSKTGFGVVPTENFHVGVKAKFDDLVYMNKVIPEDSIFSIGENTIYFNTYGNNIYGGTSGVSGIFGVGFGSPTAYGKGVRSVAIGSRVRADGENSIIIGQSNPATSPQFRNTIDNSLMIGFNSNIPTITVLPANGTGTTGNVGIGTSTPDVPLTLVSQSTQNYSYAMKTVTNNALTKAYAVCDLSSGNPVENFLVYGNGTVYCREVFVKLGVLGDFVFDEDYDLMKYDELENYLKLNHHLPGIPSEPEVLSTGLNVGEMQALVLQKTEENTLYILDLNQRLEEKERENESLKKELEILKEKQEELEIKFNSILSKK